MANPKPNPNPNTNPNPNPNTYTYIYIYTAIYVRRVAEIVYAQRRVFLAVAAKRLEVSG